MVGNDLIFGMLIGLLFGILDTLENKKPKYYSCPSYCAVIHSHIGADNEEKEPNEKGPVQSHGYPAHDDKPKHAASNNGVRIVK
jgi:hypothetical protein